MKKDWEYKTLGDVLAVLKNGVNCKQDKKGVGDKISRIESISNADFDIDKVGYTILSKTDKEKYRLEKGDILFSHINSPVHVGKTALFNSDEEVYHGVNLLLMRPKSFLNVSYFEHYLKFLFQNGYWKGLCKQSVNQASVNQQDINKVEINYPKSLPEQQRIVTILDQAFAAIATAKANAQLNLQNARDLFESYLQSVFENRKWVIKTLGDVCEKVEYGSSTKSKIKGEIAVLRMGNIQNGKFDWDKLVYSDNVEENEKYLLKYNDVLFNRTNSPALVGKTAIYKGEIPAIFAGYLIRIHRKVDLLDADYLNYFLNSEMALNYGKTVVISSVNQANINGTKLKTYPIPLPSLLEQQTIVQKLDTLSTETKKLEAIYQQKINDLEELKKSVLQKAFNGEL